MKKTNWWGIGTLLHVLVANYVCNFLSLVENHKMA